MSQEERRLVDASGDYCYAVRSGEPVADPEWRSCRLVLTNERLVLATSDGKHAVPHGKIELLDVESLPAELDLGDLDAAGATPLRIGDHVVLVDAPEVASLEREYCRATLHGEVVLARAPAVVGGAVQDDVGWRKARFHLEDGAVTLQFPDGDRVEFDVAAVGAVERDEQAVLGEQRIVLAVEHADAEGHGVETHLSGTDRHARDLHSLFESAVEDRGGDYELSEDERQVLVALYSGVSPFEMADFVGLGVDEVETIYRDLLDAGAVDAVRTRTEVTLNAQGRNMASEAMNEE